MSRERAARPARPADETPSKLQRGLALGYLAMLPLFAAYEVALARSSGGARNLAELCLSAPLAALGERTDEVRWALLAAFALVAIVATYRSSASAAGVEDLGLMPRLWRIVVEGAIAAVLIGPVLLALVSLFGVEAGATSLRTRMEDGAPLAYSARIAGGAAYEELVFRVGLQSLLFVLLRPIVHVLGATERWSRATVEVLALVLAAFAFAAAHLAQFVDVLGQGGERYDPLVFTWRVLAGILLGGLFRWRGPGVAAWTHALFNLALSIGAGPDVFL